MDKKNIYCTLPVLASGVAQCNAGYVIHTLDTPVTADTDASGYCIFFNLITGAAYNTYDASYYATGSFYINIKAFSGYAYIWGNGASGGDDTYNQFATTTVDSNTYVAMLSSGTTVGSGLTYNGSGYSICNISSGVTTGDWLSDGTHGYLGMTFGDGTTTYYGWAEISISSNGSVTIYSVGYNDLAGASIVTGVPEPSESAALAGLLAGSAAAFGAIRRRRNKAIAA